MMYIANQNYMSNDGMVKRGEEVKNPLPAHIEKGLVREAKVIEAKETKAKPKPKAKAKKETK